MKPFFICFLLFKLIINEKIKFVLLKMISFLLEEGVLTVGTLSGLFTTGLLNSLKNNIIDPSIENLYPSHKLDKAPVKIPVKVKNEENLQNGKSNFADIFPITVGAVPPTNPAEKNIIKW